MGVHGRRAWLRASPKRMCSSCLSTTGSCHHASMIGGVAIDADGSRPRVLSGAGSWRDAQGAAADLC
eukprot:366571-Chlamydomonas_euryale.AAC.16